MLLFIHSAIVLQPIYCRTALTSGKYRASSDTSVFLGLTPFSDIRALTEVFFYNGWPISPLCKHSDNPHIIIY